MTDSLLAWHFLPADSMTRFEPRIKVEVGQTLTETRPLMLCNVGLHASVKPLDALRYAPGCIVCRVRLSGQVLHGDDKLCASERTCLAMADATNLMHEFACWCAEQALTRDREAGREPDPRSWAVIEAKRQWIKGEITDEQLAAARDAARDAVSAAAWAAAWDALNEELERRLLSLLGITELEGVRSK